ncbi:MAG: single-stranded DNA-binding protein [Candidatus Paceibacterota bacterium]
MYLNKAFVIGNLTRDPEMRSLPSGVPVTNFSVATNRVWKDKDGNKQESAEFHNIVVFSRQAETVAQYLKKGSSVLVEGRLQTRSWEGQDGQKRYRTEIVADRVQFGPRGSSDSASAANTPSDNQDTGQNENLDTIEYPEEDIKSEDIPF